MFFPPIFSNLVEIIHFGHETLMQFFKKRGRKDVFSTAEVVEHTSPCILVLFNWLSFRVCFPLSESKHYLSGYEAKCGKLW